MDTRRPARAFTLIELMIVIAIIAILAAILIPNFMHARAEAQTYSCEGNLKQLATAMEEYAADNSGQYPPSIAALKAANSGVYLKAVPPDPSGGAYAITITATILLVVVFKKGPLGVLVGNFTGTLIAYAALLLYSRHALGLQFDRLTLMPFA
jgi:prepilin-type N-terminal cleavage/methylation domain-containing protein